MLVCHFLIDSILLTDSIRNTDQGIKACDADVSIRNTDKFVVGQKIIKQSTESCVNHRYIYISSRLRHNFSNLPILTE